MTDTAVAACTCRGYSTGTSTAMTAEACTLSGGNTVATITSTTKRIIDPETAISLYDNGVLQAASTYTLNHLYGFATKASGSWTGPVTITAAYLPVLELDETVSAKLAFNRTVLSKDVFSAAGYKRRMLGLGSVTADLAFIARPRKDYDPGAGSLILEDVLNSATLKVFKFTWPGSSLTFSMFCLMPTMEFPEQVDGRVESRGQFLSTGSSDPTMPRAYSWSDGT